MSEKSRAGGLLRAVAIFGVAVPLLVLAALYAGSRVTTVPFGTVIFGVTALTALAWFIFAGWGRRMDAARPAGELFRNSATDYGKEVSEGAYAQLPLPTRVLVVLTGTVLLGWAVVMATI